MITGKKEVERSKFQGRLSSSLKSKDVNVDWCCGHNRGKELVVAFPETGLGNRSSMLNATWRKQRFMASVQFWGNYITKLSPHNLKTSLFFHSFLVH
jgi:hypothetical protein